MKKFINKHKISLIGSALGAIGGYLYWFYIGCATGTCPITANWYTSAVYGVLLGWLFGDLVQGIITKKKQTTEVN